MRKWAVPLLAIYLIASGLLPLIKVNLPSASLILSVLAIAAGILLLVGGAQIRLQRNLGVILLAIWLILVGILPLRKPQFPFARNHPGLAGDRGWRVADFTTLSNP